MCEEQREVTMATNFGIKTAITGFNSKIMTMCPNIIGVPRIFRGWVCPGVDAGFLVGGRWRGRRLFGPERGAVGVKP